MEQTNNNFFFWRLQLQKEVLFIFIRLIPSFILEKILEVLKKDIEGLWYHHEFFQMMSKENKDIILRNHFGIIRPVFECFWKSIYELYFYKEEYHWKEGAILSILENDYEYLKSQIEQFWKGLIIESYTNNQEWNEDIRRNKDFILQDHYKMIRKGVEQFWENSGQELLFKLRHDLILEEVLEMLKKEIEQFWYHHEFFQMMSKENKDIILKNHFGIIIPAIECFWKSIYELYFYEENQELLRKKQRILGFYHRYIKDEFEKFYIEKFYKSLNEYYTNSPEWNEEIRRNKDFIFQDHSDIIRKGMEQLWQDLGQEVLVRLRNDLILEEVLEMMKKQIEGFWYHHEFFQMMSKENKDIILRNHFGIIRPVIEWFWKYFYEFFLFLLYKDKQNQDLFWKYWKEGTILSILENNFEYVKDEIQTLYKSLNESYTNSQEWNEEIRRNKDFIFQDLSEMIRKGIEQLWEDPDSSNSN